MGDQAGTREGVELRGCFVPRDVVLPPPQPGVRYVRVPVRAVIVIADDPLRARVDRFFHWPMIVLALSMLPLLAWEFLAPPQWGTWQWWASAAALALIWTAFFVEFVVKIAIAESRVEYLKRNWLDVIILAVPLIRPLRIASLARTGQLFTLRGVGMKCLRYVFTILIGLEATDRFLERIGLRTKKGRLDPRMMTRHQLMQEVTRLRGLTDRWDEWFKQHQLHIQRYGTCAPLRQPESGEPGMAPMDDQCDLKHVAPGASAACASPPSHLRFLPGRDPQERGTVAEPSAGTTNEVIIARSRSEGSS